MNQVPLRFLVGGLGAAVLAGVLAYFLGASVASPTGSLAIAAALAVGNVAAAFWAASDNDRRQHPLACARLGLAAAALSFVALYVVIAPVLLRLPASPLPGLAYYGALAATGLVALLLVWLSLRLAWRRFSPTKNAP